MSIQTHQWDNTRRSSFRLERWTWSTRLWLMVAIVLAVLLHFWLFRFFEQHQVMRPDIAPPAPVERIKVNPQLIERMAQPIIPDIIAENQRAQEPDTKADFSDIAEMLPDDRSFDLTPDVSKITNFQAPDANPQALTPAMSPSFAALAETLEGDNGSTISSTAINSSALKSQVSDKQMLLAGQEIETQLDGANGQLLDQLNKASAAGNGAAQKMEGFSNLDELINRGSSVNASTDPILMPTDLLFDYGSSELADSARLSLMKLGLLIQRNPNNRFIIEGHTDSFGGDEYNVELSQRRAQAVVNWLINSLQINTERVQAVGLGKTRLLVPEGDVNAQSINRRVEIKIRPLN